MVYQVSRRLNVLVMHAEPILAAGLVASLRQATEIDVFVFGVDVLSPGDPTVDVVVADHTTAIGLARDVKGARRNTLGNARILVVSTQVREHEVRLALEAGVHGYLLLGCGIEELLTGVRQLGRGSKYLCLEVAQRMADSLTREALTSREAEVLRLLSMGQCNKTIANALDIAVGTVKAHVKGIMSKLDAASRTEAVSIATKLGLVDSSMGESQPAAGRYARANDRLAEAA